MNDYDESYKIILLGDNAVGKTAISQSLPGKYKYDYSIKIEELSFIELIIKIENNEIQLLFWDKEQIKSVSDSYIHKLLSEAFCIIFVFSLDSRVTFDNLEKWYELSENYKVKKILVGNKLDLINKREVSKQEIEFYAKEKNLPYIETSAKNKANMKELLDFILK